MGVITSPPAPDKHYAESGKITNYVQIRFERLIDPFRCPERRLDPRAIEAAGFTIIRSGPQRSGTRVRDAAVADRLKTLFEERSRRGRLFA